MEMDVTADLVLESRMSLGLLLGNVPNSLPGMT